MPRNPQRPLASHVQAAIAKGRGVGVQGKMEGEVAGAGGRPMAAHVQRAIAAARGVGVQGKIGERFEPLVRDQRRLPDRSQAAAGVFGLRSGIGRGMGPRALGVCLCGPPRDGLESLPAGRGGTLRAGVAQRMEAPAQHPEMPVEGPIEISWPHNIKNREGVMIESSLAYENRNAKSYDLECEECYKNQVPRAKYGEADFGNILIIAIYASSGGVKWVYTVFRELYVVPASFFWV